MQASKRETDSLWLRTAASRWVDAFPLGNGHLGAMLFGRPERERLALNHENLWRGVTRTRTTEPAHAQLEAIRQGLFDGHWVEAAELAKKHLGGQEERLQPYQPVGDLTLINPGHGTVFNYRRTLHLETGIAEVSYRVGEITFRRELFVSAPHNVLVLHITADQPGAITTMLAMQRATDPECALRFWSDESRFGLEGVFKEGIHFALEARVLAQGGMMQAGPGASVQVSKADELLVILTIATDYKEADPADWCVYHLDVVPMDYSVLREAHLSEYRPLFDRVRLEVTRAPEAEVLPLDERLKRLKGGGEDPSLLALQFLYGRYLLMASSRRCSQPATRQGIWTEALRAPHASAFHHNGPLQMCYWPAEVCNLPECLEPLVSYLERAKPEARKAARDLYNCRGISLPYRTDLWDRATPEVAGWDVWTGAAAWLVQHLWWHYEFTLDGRFLQDHVYPYLLPVVEFYEDYLIRNPQGRLVPVPSQSPENTFVGGAWPVSLGIGSTLDLLLIRETLKYCLRASKLLECDEPRRATWQSMLTDLPPYQIGADGELLEWMYPFQEMDPGHSFFSPLYGVFPGDEMTPDAWEMLAQAARMLLERRLAAPRRQDSGWSRAWAAALWARFGEGDQAYRQLLQGLAGFASDSLLATAGSTLQLDGTLGATAAIAEMLLQSQGNVLRLLPALPTQWRKGTVTGLRARGNFVVNLSWRNGALTEARITSLAGQPCRVAWSAAPCEVSAHGVHVTTTRDADGHLLFPTKRGEIITIRPTAINVLEESIVMGE
jgi:alpha-L-fucosidase 2